MYLSLVQGVCEGGLKKLSTVFLSWRFAEICVAVIILLSTLQKIKSSPLKTGGEMLL